MTDRIRVLHVIDSLDLGGAQTVLASLVRQTDKSRFEVAVATMHGRGVFWEMFEGAGMRLHSLSPHKHLPLYVPNLARLVCSFRPQIVHCHLFGSNWIAKPLAALLGVPVRISHDHCNDGTRYESGLALRLDRAMNQFSSHICAVSDSIRAFLVQREGIDAGRITVVYNGVDLGRFKPGTRDRRQGGFRVLGVGRLVHQKNFGMFLEVARILIREGLPFCFQIAGTGPDEEELRRRAAELGIAGQVDFLGHVRDMAGLYAGADALLLTSRYEGTPMTALEAIAAGLAVVSSRLDGLAEILVEGEEALMAGPEDADGFAAHLRRLNADPGFRAGLTAAALAKVRARFSAEAMADSIQEIYEACLQRAGTGS